MESSEKKYLTEKLIEYKDLAFTCQSVINDRNKQDFIVQNAIKKSNALRRIMEIRAKEPNANINQIIAGMEFIDALLSLRLMVQELQGVVSIQNNLIQGLQNERDNLHEKYNKKIADLNHEIELNKHELAWLNVLPKNIN